MAEVLEFPSQEARAFAFLERELRAMLVAKGADEGLITFALDALTSVYAELEEASDFGFQIDLPANITEPDAIRLQQQIAEGIDGLRSQHHALVLQLAARLVLTEMKLFQHQRASDSSEN